MTITGYSWMRPGAACWYTPFQGSDKRYPAVISSAPWRVGVGLCVSLIDLPEVYMTDMGRHTTHVVAAACWAVEPRVVESL